MQTLRQLTLVGSLATAAGFSLPACSTPTTQHAVRSVAPLMAEQDINAFGLTTEQSRRAVLAGVAGAVIGVGASPVNAGYVTNLGIATSDPKEAELDAELLKTREVQQGISNIRGYKKAAGALQKQFSVNTDVPLIPTIRKYFDLSKLRDDLNVVTAVFDEGTQPTIDRLSRAILYDLTELENASRFKKGEAQTRTAKKVDNVNKWFTKLDADFDTLISYLG